MKSIWHIIQAALAAVGGWIGAALGGADGTYKLTVTITGRLRTDRQAIHGLRIIKEVLTYGDAV